MKLYKLSILALALAGTMAACSDDDYTAPVATPGAFFPASSPELVELPMTGNSVDITVRRNSNVPQDQTFLLTSSDSLGLLKIPSSITFIGQELTAQLHITFDPEKIETDKTYPAEIKIDGMANSWGITDYQFRFGRMTPYDITELGEGVYIYSCYSSGATANEVELKVNPNNPDVEYYIVKNWCNTSDDPEDPNGYDMQLKVRKDIILPNGYPLVELGWQDCNFTNTNYAAIKIIGYLDWCIFNYKLTLEEIINKYQFNLESTSGSVILSPDMVSYFDTDKGVLHLYNCAGAFDADDNYLGRFVPDWEYLYLPGYPDYDVQLSYLGFFTNADDELTAIGELYAGEDVENVDLYNIAGDDIAAALAQIESGALEPSQSITPETTDAIQVKFTVPGAGTYTMIAVVYGEGEIQGYDYATYTIAGNAPAVENWESIGQGVYYDGWILPAYSVNPFEWGWYVEIEKNLDVDGEYRMVNPFGESCPVSNANLNKKATNIVFSIADPEFPTVPFQFSGYEDEDGRLWIADADWTYENQGYGKEICQQVPQVAAQLSYFVEGVLEITCPWFAADRSTGKFTSNVEQLGIQWNGNYPSELVFPESSQAATSAKAIRHMVSKDNFIRNAKSMNKMVEQRKKIRKDRGANLGKPLSILAVMDAGMLR
ncbi:MAG: hypothetical protein NC102_03630 [Clostridium sp.]|nr:hypothetical protein [Clostridium sp.]